MLFRTEALDSRDRRSDSRVTFKSKLRTISKRVYKKEDRGGEKSGS